MPVEWGNQLVLKLIELYESKGCLWDTKNREYKNKIKKYDVWEELANELQIPRKDVEAKIHNLRSQFVRTTPGHRYPILRAFLGKYSKFHPVESSGSYHGSITAPYLI
ncbi:hypothetical protein JYU34_000646 [Plutella xylostella]|uniref:MADF domain-containing protein n=1 Tax=Plutella xylostella TaxID=51655 RepID=A0ABQ7R897_PLUXY|nr:hypothetical protein JYU34_000646 [Plutella xylostella]